MAERGRSLCCAICGCGKFAGEDAMMCVADHLEKLLRGGTVIFAGGRKSVSFDSLSAEELGAIVGASNERFAVVDMRSATEVTENAFLVAAPRCNCWMPNLSVGKRPKLLLLLEKEHFDKKIDREAFVSRFFSSYGDSARAVILVPSLLNALKSAARSRLESDLRNAKVSLVTGTIGKSTTLEVLSEILKAGGPSEYHVQDQVADEVGVLSAVLSAPRGVNYILVEASQKDGIAKRLVAELGVHVAVLAGVTQTDISLAGGKTNMVLESASVLQSLRSSGVGILYGDHDVLYSAAFSVPVLKYGFKTRNHIHIRQLKPVMNATAVSAASMVLRIHSERIPLTVQTAHRGIILDMAAAAAAAHAMGVESDAIASALAGWRTRGKRFGIQKLKNGSVLIEDSERVTPDSVRNALEALEAARFDGKKIVVVGRLEETGDRVAFWYRHVGRVISRSPSIATVFLSGDRCRHVSETVPSDVELHFFDSEEEARKAAIEIAKRERTMVLLEVPETQADLDLIHASLSSGSEKGTSAV